MCTKQTSVNRRASTAKVTSNLKEGDTLAFRCRDTAAGAHLHPTPAEERGLSAHV